MGENFYGTYLITSSTDRPASRELKSFWSSGGWTLYKFLIWFRQDRHTCHRLPSPSLAIQRPHSLWISNIIIETRLLLLWGPQVSCRSRSWHGWWWSYSWQAARRFSSSAWMIIVTRIGPMLGMSSPSQTIIYRLIVTAHQIGNVIAARSLRKPQRDRKAVFRIRPICI